MPIDIDQLTEDELRDLNHRIVARLSLIHQLRAHGAMLTFSIGDRVTFIADGRRIFGTLTRYNRKTVTIIAENGNHWTVSPTLVQRAVESSGTTATVVEQPLRNLPAGRK